MPKRSPLPPRALAVLVSALAIASSAAARSRDALYQWTDAGGAVRYTTRVERIPEEWRGAAVVVVAGAPGAARPAEEPQRSSDAPSAQPAQPSAQPAQQAQPAQPPVETAPAPLPPADPKVAELDAQIAELEQSIAADEAALADYISDPKRAERQPESGDIAAIADRLPKRQNELRQLRERRAAATGTAPVNAAP